eukprot:176220-Chlamydomonas_euryale.AAC.1
MEERCRAGGLRAPPERGRRQVGGAQPLPSQAPRRAARQGGGRALVQCGCCAGVLGEGGVGRGADM